MAKVYQAPNENRLEVEAYIAAESAKEVAYEKRLSKKRPFVLLLCVLLIVATAVAALFAFFGPGVFEKILSAVKDALNQWADQVRFSYDELENGDYSGDLGERLLSGIGGCFLILLRGLGAFLLDLLALISPVIVIAVILAIACGIIYVNLGVISDYGWRASTPEEIREWVIWQMDGDMKKLLAGLEGEDAALDAVSRLGNDCHIFANLDVWLDDHKNETDLIVVSPSGLTIIEVKNYSGTLLGDLSQPKITQRKFKKNGEYTDKEADNPAHQIEAPAKKLETFLLRKGISAEVRRCALFTNEHVDIQVSDAKGIARTCPLFKLGSTELLPYLHANSWQPLDNVQIRNIVSALSTFL